MTLAGGQARALLDGHTQALAEFAGQRVRAIAAIGNPGRFFDSLRSYGLDVVEQAFPDHHAYTAAELDFHDTLPLLMTEKDAVKCAAFAQPHWWAVPVRAELPASFLAALIQRVGALKR